MAHNWQYSACTNFIGTGTGTHIKEGQAAGEAGEIIWVGRFSDSTLLEGDDLIDTAADAFVNQQTAFGSLNSRSYSVLGVTYLGEY